MPEREEYVVELVNAKKEFDELLSKSQFDIKQFASKIRSNFGNPRGFSEGTFSKKIAKYGKLESLMVGDLKRLKKFFVTCNTYLEKLEEKDFEIEDILTEEQIDGMAKEFGEVLDEMGVEISSKTTPANYHLIYNDHRKIELSNNVDRSEKSLFENQFFEKLRHTNWEYFYCKDDHNSNITDIFCGMLRIGDNVDEISFETQAANTYKGVLDLSYPGVLKFELSIAGIFRPLIILANVGNDIKRPNILIASYTNVSENGDLLEGLGILKFAKDRKKNEIIRKIDQAALFGLDAEIQLFFKDPLRISSRVKLAKSAAEIIEVAKSLHKD